MQRKCSRRRMTDPNRVCRRLNRFDFGVNASFS
jgi:hypothetical protein